METLYKAAARRLNNASDAPAGFERIEGLEHFDKVIDIDQSPIGRTPRSNPATYTGAFTAIRDWFAGLPEAKARASTDPAVSASTSRAAVARPAQGDSLIKIEMHFLPDIYVTPAASAVATATTARLWRSCFAASPSPTCST